MMMPFYEGGWPVWVVLAFTLLGLVASVIALAVQGSRGAAIALASGVLCVGLMTALVGIGGWLYGRAQVDEVLVLFAGTADIDALRTQGYSEAIWSLYCGLAGAAIPLLLGTGALVRALLREPARVGTRG